MGPVPNNTPIIKGVGSPLIVTPSVAVKVIPSVAVIVKELALSIVGTPFDVDTNLFAYAVLRTVKLFCTVRSDDVVTGGVITIPLLSSVSMTLAASVKFPILSPDDGASIKVNAPAPSVLNS